LDRECTDKATELLRRGGHLHLHDFKIAEAFGIPRMHDGVAFGFADELLIVTDSMGKVVAIFRHAGLDDLDVVEGVLDGKLRVVDYVDRAAAKLAAMARDEQTFIDLGDRLSAVFRSR
jgi:hypothetical protein